MTILTFSSISCRAVTLLLVTIYFPSWVTLVTITTGLIIAGIGAISIIFPILVIKFWTTTTLSLFCLT